MNYHVFENLYEVGSKTPIVRVIKTCPTKKEADKRANELNRKQDEAPPEWGLRVYYVHDDSWKPPSPKFGEERGLRS